MPKKIIITGGPSTGKTSIIEELKKEGHQCMDEVSREVILEARKKGIEHLFLKSPIHFSEILLKKRVQQYFDADKTETTHVFFDRGIIDIIAYLKFSKTTHNIKFQEALYNMKFDYVFICPPWEEIHTTDNERYESFEEAIKIHNDLVACYKREGYSVIEIPKGTVKERYNFILNKIS